MTGVQQEPTFWQFTASSAKAAVQLYFEPIYRITEWLQPKEVPTNGPDRLRSELDSLRQNFRELERRVYASPDSLSGLELRVLRLRKTDLVTRIPAFMLTIEWAEGQLELAQRFNALDETKQQEEILRGLRPEVRRMEQALEFDGRGQSSGAGAD